ncbi:serpin family protein [Aldersonia sp. NBC_00410]|uniref:serpin family protein n=1 Tax=Aldersonia sp. NBC_00410 TaxID=2975954 RepID=UPI0022559673|nr:serpin family protein [Aldersonia sp. NBC_00410]MCX5045246.1 serpin family protein [Aldersonia sp. NBC_00410]
MTAPPLAASVTAANDLTARWCAAARRGEFVLSGAGLWPLLALLASAADGPARDELQRAAGEGHGTTEAIEVLRALSGGVATSAALGVWVRADLPLHRDWVSTLPVGVVEELTGQQRLDAWAAEHTRGMIERFPLQVRPTDLLVLATALAAKTRWREPFDPGPVLTRSTHDLDQIAVLGGSVTRVVVEGEDELDVHLLLGHDALGVGIAALDGTVGLRSGSSLEDGSAAPGLTVRTTRGEADSVRVSLPPFEIRSSHDLCADPELFGLTSAMDTEHGHFPAISPEPLAISQGAQDVYAAFSAEGFEAAAVTAFAMQLAGVFMPPRKRVRLIEVKFEPPFGFLAVHRPSGLVVVAGQVAP